MSNRAFEGPLRTISFNLVDGSWEPDVVGGHITVDKAGTKTLRINEEDGVVHLKRRCAIMKKQLAIFLAWIMLASFSAGCAGVSKEAQVKCPKCGAVFKIYEGRPSGGDKQ